MSKIFISYSSKDRTFVEKLAKDLLELKHTIWYDEWEIKVGDIIPKKISDGLEKTDYVIVVLSSSSVKSQWVEREWQSKYWEEIEKGEIKVLPVLIEKCDIPILLKSKKYANFTDNYSVALVKLIASIDPVISNNFSDNSIFKTGGHTNKISSLIEKAHSRTNPLSQVIAEGLAISIKGKYGDLENFCRMELKGYDEVKNEKIPDHRLKEIFLSPYGDLNLNYMGWSNNPSSMFEYMRQNPKKFLSRKMGFPDNIAQIEEKVSSYSATAVYSFTMPYKHFVKKADNPDTPLRIYAQGDTYISLLESIRRKFVQLLLETLPSVEN